jgi:hypothetical protein
MAQYRSLVDIYTPDGHYAEASQILSDQGGANTIPIPTGWIPATGAVDPITPDAVQNYWQAGPAGANDAEPHRQQFIVSKWSGRQYAPPAIYWTRHDASSFILTGAGASLGIYNEDAIRTSSATAPHAVIAPEPLSIDVGIPDAPLVVEKVRFRLTQSVVVGPAYFSGGDVVSNVPPPSHPTPSPMWKIIDEDKHWPGLNHTTMVPGMVPLDDASSRMKALSRYSNETVSATISGRDSIGREQTWVSGVQTGG